MGCRHDLHSFPLTASAPNAPAKFFRGDVGFYIPLRHQSGKQNRSISMAFETVEADLLSAFDHLSECAGHSGFIAIFLRTCQLGRSLPAYGCHAFAFPPALFLRGVLCSTPRLDLAVSAELRSTPCFSRQDDHRPTFQSKMDCRIACPLRNRLARSYMPPESS